MLVNSTNGKMEKERTPVSVSAGLWLSLPGGKEKKLGVYLRRESLKVTLWSHTLKLGIVEKKDAHSRLDRLVQASASVYKPIWVGECPLMWAHGGVGCCNGF